MKNKTSKSFSKVFKYILWTLVGYIGAITGYDLFKIIEYYIKPVVNPLMPLDFYKAIAFPYLSFIPFLLGLLFLGAYFIWKKYYKKGYVACYLVLILIFHLMQNSLFDFFNSFNPYVNF